MHEIARVQHPCCIRVEETDLESQLTTQRWTLRAWGLGHTSHRSVSGCPLTWTGTGSSWDCGVLNCLSIFTSRVGFKEDFFCCLTSEGRTSFSSLLKKCCVWLLEGSSVVSSRDVSQKAELESPHLLSPTIDHLLLSLWLKQGTVMGYRYYFHPTELYKAWSASYRAIWKKRKEIYSGTFLISVDKNTYPYNWLTLCESVSQVQAADLRKWEIFGLP